MKETIPVSEAEGPGRLLVLLNPGDFSRQYLIQMVAAATRLGIGTAVCELSDVWQRRQSGQGIDVGAFAETLREQRIKAVISYTLHGVWEWCVSPGADATARSVFADLGIPHLLWWSDHPQWANNKDGLRPELQPLLSSPTNHHFVKSDVAARELREILGWPNCFSMPVAENPSEMRPATGAEPDFDVVAIVGSPPKRDPGIDRLLRSDDPDVEAILRTVAKRAAKHLSALWREHAPEALRPTLEVFGRAWVDARRYEPLTGSFRLFTRLQSEHREATGWLRANYRVYFDAIEALWEFGRWQRTFVLRYLSRFFRVGVFGSDWSSVGLGGVKRRIPHVDQPKAYARGRVAINILQAGDEEGVSHKPFQIAAAGVPMVHIQRQGLSDCFAPGVEVETFSTPREARDIITALLADPDRRKSMAAAARERLFRQHTWEHRLPRMLAAAGVTFPGVKLPVTEPVNASVTADVTEPASAEADVVSPAATTRERQPAELCAPPGPQ